MMTSRNWAIWVTVVVLWLTATAWYEYCVVNSTSANTEPQQATHIALSRAEQIALMQECINDADTAALRMGMGTSRAVTKAVIAAAFFDYRIQHGN